MKQEIHVLVRRCKDSDLGIIGAKKVKCSVCDNDCWLLPTFKDDYKKGKIDKLICEECFKNSSESYGEMRAKGESIELASEYSKIHGELISPDKIIRNIEKRSGKKVKIV